jgi:hypothetical protein
MSTAEVADFQTSVPLPDFGLGITFGFASGLRFGKGFCAGFFFRIVAARLFFWSG